jgi:xanthine dehydrogenase accessory factor
MASGIVHRLYEAGLRRMAMLETDNPLCVRRYVSFCEAVHDGAQEVEGVRARRVDTIENVVPAWEAGEIAVIVDPDWKIMPALAPDVVVDAIMAKRNLGTGSHEARLVIGVGPGFTAPHDVHAVIESNRGHDLGRVIYNGSAEPHTGIPGTIEGLSAERVLRAPIEGRVTHVRSLGDEVKKGDLLLHVGNVPVYAPFDGILRGLIREMHVARREKVGDVDPRASKRYCYTISEKARSIGGGVLEAILHEFNTKCPKRT